MTPFELKKLVRAAQDGGPEDYARLKDAVKTFPFTRQPAPVYGEDCPQVPASFESLIVASGLSYAQIVELADLAPSYKD